MVLCNGGGTCITFHRDEAQLCRVGSTDEERRDGNTCQVPCHQWYHLAHPSRREPSPRHKPHALHRMACDGCRKWH